MRQKAEKHRMIITRPIGTDGKYVRKLIDPVLVRMLIDEATHKLVLS